LPLEITPEQVDVLGKLHAAKLFDIGVRSRRLIGFDDLDLALAEVPALRIDLLGGKRMPL
jgi:hypothetical protein